MRQSILIIAAGPLQVPAIEEAAALGLRTVTVDANPRAPGMALADAAHVVDILDAAAVIEIARAEKVGGVMTLCTDAPVRTVAAVALALGLPALSPAAAARATDKRLMRRALSASQVPVPRFREVDSVATALAAAAALGYPVALKISCSSGSRGVYRVDGPVELAKRFVQARAYQPEGALLIEDWMDGPEVSVEGICGNGHVHVLQVTDKLVFPGPFPVEAGHIQPSRLSPAIVARVRSVTEAGARALGLSDCAFHAELKITRDGPKIVEIGARLGGDRIATHLTPLSTGVNLLRAAILTALGREFDITPTRAGGAAIRYFHAGGLGTLDAVEGLDGVASLPGLELLYAASERDGPLRPGFGVGEIRSSLDRYGHVIFSGGDAAQAAERAERAAALVKFRFRPSISRTHHHMNDRPFLPFALPELGDDELSAVLATLQSGWLTTGKATAAFEGEFRRYAGAAHSLAVNSCTAGLHLALAALGIGPGDEVITTPLTFCATVNVILQVGARPVLADIGPDLNLDPAAIERALSPRTRAILPVHYGGLPCDMDAIWRTALNHGLSVVEDAAHATGASYRGVPIGSGLSDAVVFSFYATKNLTTGEGGMVTTPSAALAERMRILCLHGISRDAWSRYSEKGSWYYEVVDCGFKYNMSDIMAALGTHQLRRLDRMNARRAEIAAAYNEAFIDMPEVELPPDHLDSHHAWHLYPLRLNLDALSVDRARFFDEMRARGIGCSVHFIPIPLHPYYRENLEMRDPCDRAISEYSRLISLPIYSKMSDEDVSRVIRAVQEVVMQHRTRRQVAASGVAAWMAGARPEFVEQPRL